MPLSIGTRVGAYEIVAPIGAGGMGEIYRACDSRLDREVAIKVLPAEFTADHDRVRRFVQEAKAASALSHPNIITIYEIGEGEFGRFIAMELVEGRTLREMIGEPLSWDKLSSLCGQAAKALAVAHASGIVHRDIKPENIIVRPDGYVKVLDFGLARLAAAETPTPERTVTSQTTPGVLLGTLAYMSPEQASGEAVTSATDVFALGIVLYELATGQRPFRAATMLGVLQAIVSHQPPPPSALNPAIPAELDDVIRQMLEKEATRRPTAAEVDEALTRLSAAPARLRAPAKIERHTVGRTKELAELRDAFGSVLTGRGLLLCIAGEPGIGKTTLIEEFLAGLNSEVPCTVGRGRCSERLAGTEAYLPLLEALENVMQGGGNAAIVETMKQTAPTWYAQLVSLSRDSGATLRLLNERRAASQDRMKRELSAFLQEISRVKPLVLFFDDLHWADISTIDVLSFLAAKFQGLRVLILVTYRPSELLLVKHPFLQIKPDLQARGVCRELALGFLSPLEIADYLALEFSGHRFPLEFHNVIHSKTEGSPLFMADLARYLRDRGAIAQVNGHWTLVQSLAEIERELPESVRGMIERKIAQLDEEDRRLLVAASIQGYEFDSAVIAQALRVDAGELEERLDRLDRVFAFVRLVSERELPSRVLTLRYRFVHMLYQNALYASLRATRKAALARDVAEALEGCYSEQQGSVAHELAALWESARDYDRAAGYFCIAAQQASKVFAIREAVQLARRGLAMVEKLADSRERGEQELSLLVVLANALIATQGYGAPEVEQTYARAQQLGHQLGQTAHLLPVLWGLNAMNLMRANYRKVMQPGQEFLHLIEKEKSPAVVIAHRVLGQAFLFSGELAPAREHFEQIVSIYDPALHRPLTWLYAQEPGMAGHALLGLTLWLSGYPDQALAHSRESLRLGREVCQANSHANALFWAGLHCQFRRDWQQVREFGEAMTALAQEQGLAFWLAVGAYLHGSALALSEQTAEGIDEARRGIAGIQSAGSELLRSCCLCFLAEAYGSAGMPAEGLLVLDDAQALIVKKEERFWEAEVCRVRGELLLQQGSDESEIDACFQKAIAIARRQQAKSLELRAAVSLARFSQRQSKAADAERTLAGIYGWFTEGFETADLETAKSLLTGQGIGSRYAGSTGL